MTLTPVFVLILLGIAFLVANALNKLPAWTWGLVLFLILLLGR